MWKCCCAARSAKTPKSELVAMDSPVPTPMPRAGTRRAIILDDPFSHRTTAGSHVIARSSRPADYLSFLANSQWVIDDTRQTKHVAAASSEDDFVHVSDLTHGELVAKSLFGDQDDTRDSRKLAALINEISDMERTINGTTPGSTEMVEI